MNNISAEQKYGVEGPVTAWSGKTSPSICKEKNLQNQKGTWNGCLVRDVTQEKEVENSDNEEDNDIWHEVKSVNGDADQELQSTTSSLKSFKQVNQASTPTSTVVDHIESIQDIGSVVGSVTTDNTEIKTTSPTSSPRQDFEQVNQASTPTNTVKDLIESIDGLMKEEASRKEPQLYILSKFLEAKFSHLNAVRALNNIDDPNRENRASYLHQLGIIRVFEAIENQRDIPRKEVMGPLFKADEFYQKAIAALDSISNPTKRVPRVPTASYLAEEGRKLLAVALKADPKADPILQRKYNQMLVKPLQAEYQSSASVLLSAIEEEKSKANPRQDIINKFNEANEFYLQAVDVLNNINDVNRENRARYLHQLGMIRSVEAREIQRDNPRKEVIDNLLKAGKSYQEAITKLDSISDSTSSVREAFELAKEGDNYLALGLTANQFLQIKDEQRFVNPLQAKYQLSADKLLSIIEKEKNKANPRQYIIDKFIEAKKLHLQAVDVLNNIYDFHRENRASYLHQLGIIRFLEAREIRKDNPRKGVIDPLLKAGQSYQQAITALNSISDPTRSVRKAFELAKKGSKFLARALKAKQPHQRIDRSENTAG